MELLKEIGLVSLTTVLSIVVLFVLTKWMGVKQVSQMTMFDYVEGITIGSVAAELATDLDAPLNSLTALALYGLAAVGISLWTSHSLKARRMAAFRQHPPGGEGGELGPPGPAAAGIQGGRGCASGPVGRRRKADGVPHGARQARQPGGDAVNRAETGDCRIS